MFKASAPGSLMLLGEYAVLHGGQALVCAVDKRITVTLKPREDDYLTIQSALGRYEADLSDLQITTPFRFVLTVLKKFQIQFPSGFDLVIESDFSHEIGFASSAAVTVATLAVVNAWLAFEWDTETLLKKARVFVRKVQGIGSGADVAACVQGGLVAYRMQDTQPEKFLAPCPLTVVYSGYKTPTVEVVTQVERQFLIFPKLFKRLCRTIHECSAAGIEAVRHQNWSELGSLMNVQQGLMDALGVNTPALNQLIETLRQQDGIWGAKISGSGLGDCVIALGEFKKNFLMPNQIPCRIDFQGVICEKI